MDRSAPSRSAAAIESPLLASSMTYGEMNDDAATRPASHHSRVIYWQAEIIASWLERAVR
jgi:hypothetical protein